MKYKSHVNLLIWFVKIIRLFISPKLRNRKKHFTRYFLFKHPLLSIMESKTHYILSMTKMKRHTKLILKLGYNTLQPVNNTFMVSFSILILWLCFEMVTWRKGYSQLNAIKKTTIRQNKLIFFNKELTLLKIKESFFFNV